MKRLKLGMVGGGQGAFIGAVHRIAARIDDEFELVAGALASNPQKALASAQELGLQRSYSSYEEMASKEAALPAAKRIDAVAIVTPNHLHYPISKCFWEKGFHVICEKPMCHSVEEALALKQLVDQKPEQAYVLTHNYTGYPMVREARAIVQSGGIGNIRFVELKYIQGWFAQPLENKQVAWRTDPKLAGLGGSLGDIATHAENLSSFITGLQIEELAAQLQIFVPGRALDDNAQMLLRFAGGARGQLWSSQIAIGEENGLQIAIYGEKGSLKWHQEDPNYLHCASANGVWQKRTRGGGDLRSGSFCRTPAGHPEGYLEGFAQIYRDAAEWIRTKQDGRKSSAVLLPSVDEGLAGMRFIQAAWDSNQHNGAWTKV